MGAQKIVKMVVIVAVKVVVIVKQCCTIQTEEPQEVKAARTVEPAELVKTTSLVEEMLESL